MARRGFFGRIGQAIRNIVAPRPAPPPPEAPREPPRVPAPTGRGDDFRRVWRARGGRGNYRKNLEVFHSVIDEIEPDHDEQVALWDSYIRHINRGEGRFRRSSTSNMFWRDSGIDPSTWDWQAWREAMGYTGKRRSRTP